jgi:hypothetical protein
MRKTITFIVAMLIISIGTTAQTQNNSNNNSVSDYKESGFTNISEIEFGLGSGGSGFGLRTINGYQFNKHFFIGLGIGFNYQPNIPISPENILFAQGFNYNLKDLPVFIDVRYSILENEHSFFGYLDFGYSILLSSYSNATISQPDSINNYYDNYKFSGGLMYAFGIGYKLFLSHNFAWTISIGYNYTGTKATDNYYNYGYINSSPSTYRIGDYFVLRIGFAF